MKNIKILIFVGILLFTLVGCNDENTKIYKDGTYTAKGDNWEYGSEEATLVIRENKIESIILKRLDSQDKEVNYEEWTGKEVQGKIWPNLKEYKTTLANKMIEKQSYDVDAISGATITCENWKVATKRALDKAQK